MTVCVAVKVHDCIVFAADSASSLSALNGAGEQVIVNIYQNGNKVFNLRKDLPIAAMTAGIGLDNLKRLASKAHRHERSAVSRPKCLYNKGRRGKDS